MKIAIWGAGKFGCYIKNQLDKREDLTLVCFIDNNIKAGEKVEGLNVMTLEQSKEYQIDFILIAIVDLTSVFKQLKQENVDRFGIIRSHVYKLKKKLSDDIFEDKNILWLKEMEFQKPFLNYLETNIMDNCNLNCRGCSHFSNLFESNTSVTFKTFCKDLKKIADNMWVNVICLLGGEPLLNEKLTDYIEFTRKTLPLTEIEIVSNGLLIPKQSEKFFDSCRKNDIIISISGYRPTLLMKDRIINTLEEKKVDYVFRKDVTSFGKNIDLQGKAEPERAFKRCREKDCHFFRNGKLYKCPFEALGNQLFSYYDIDIQLKGGTDIYDPNLNWNELVTKLNEEPIRACSYCGKEEKMEWKIENNPKLEDWVISQ